MKVTLAVAAGGALGSVARYWLSRLTHALVATTFPLGTLLVNVIGSIVVGLLYVWLVERTGSRAELRGFLMVGVLGGFTTFSTFGFETFELARGGGLLLAAGNAAASVLLGVVGVALGAALARAV